MCKCNKISILKSLLYRGDKNTIREIIAKNGGCPKKALDMVEKSWEDSVCALVGGYCGQHGCSEYHCYMGNVHTMLLR